MHSFCDYLRDTLPGDGVLDLEENFSCHYCVVMQPY